jgi:hypothetical protein
MSLLFSFYLLATQVADCRMDVENADSIASHQERYIVTFILRLIFASFVNEPCSTLITLIVTLV